jgi:hypothetical protein
MAIQRFHWPIEFVHRLDDESQMITAVDVRLPLAHSSSGPMALGCHAVRVGAFRPNLFN